MSRHLPAANSRELLGSGCPGQFHPQGKERKGQKVNRRRSEQEEVNKGKEKIRRREKGKRGW